MSTSQYAAQRVKRLRRERGWSADHFSDRLAALGIPWTRSIVANFESGRRYGLTTDELVALAHIFSVNPTDLLIPPDLAGDDAYEVAPGLTTTAGKARDWFGGRGFLVEPQTLTELAEAIRWMPTDRANAIAREWLDQQQQATP